MKLVLFQSNKTIGIISLSGKIEDILRTSVVVVEQAWEK